MEAVPAHWFALGIAAAAVILYDIFKPQEGPKVSKANEDMPLFGQQSTLIHEQAKKILKEAGYKDTNTPFMPQMPFSSQ